MSTTPVIEIEKLTKRYRLGTGGGLTLRDAVSDGVRRLFGGAQRDGAGWHQALDGIDLSIRAGERIGFVGRNGAGKSTLLKVVSRIVHPTTGSVRVRGRVGSLLEVGTGFHPELSGRENIFLNGAILGMGRGEVSRKLEEIVEFSGVSRFLDTPVKRYSSGMYTRLAFAVAAHLESDVLIVDEVLAVGDAEFQKKCLARMGEVSRSGRTILFVSHSMQAVKTLCSRVIVLEKGRVVLDGAPDEGISHYLRSAGAGPAASDMAATLAGFPDDPDLRFLDVAVEQGGERVGIVESGRPFTVTVDYEVKRPRTGLRVFFDLCDPFGAVLLRSFHDEQADGIPTMAAGRYRSRATVPADLLGPAGYVVIVRASVYGERTVAAMDTFEGPGIPVPLTVVHTGSWNKAYPGQEFKAKLAIPFPWVTELLP